MGPSIVYAPLGLGFRIRVRDRVRVRSVISVSFRVRVRVMVSADIWRMVWRGYMLKVPKGRKLHYARFLVLNGVVEASLNLQLSPTFNYCECTMHSNSMHCHAVMQTNH